MPVHDVAAVGFGAASDVYERARPTYPPDAVGWLVDALRLGPGVTAMDLAAGTGKLTRLLAPTGGASRRRRAGRRHAPCARLDPAGRGGARRRRRGARARETASLDAVTVAQAFHWFDADVAFAELARVLRPGGRVGLIWNARDRRVAWVDEVWAVMDRVERRAPWRDHDQQARRRDRGAPRVRAAGTRRRSITSSTSRPTGSWSGSRR